MLTERAVDGFRAIALEAPADGIEAVFVPDAGMVGCSLLHRGAELLGQRGGVKTYAAERSTMGIPLLHPWANRLATSRFEVAGQRADVALAQPPPSTDPNGLPIHGLLAAASGWQVAAREGNDDGATLAARFDFAAHAGLAQAFPFPHELVLRVTLRGTTLEIETIVTASGDAPVPIAFGYHPYFQLPGVDRANWQVEIPIRERLVLDDLMLPTGARERVDISSGPLGLRTFDDAYLAPSGGEAFGVSCGDRRIEVAFGPGFPYAQVYAPADDDVIAIEPMTAPTNALVTGGPELSLIEPGESYVATFSIAIEGA